MKKSTKYLDLAKKINKDYGVYRCFIAYILGNRAEKITTDDVVEKIYTMWLDPKNKINDLLIFILKLTLYCEKNGVKSSENLLKQMNDENFLTTFNIFLFKKS